MNRSSSKNWSGATSTHPEGSKPIQQRLKDRIQGLSKERESTIRAVHNRLRFEFPRYCEEKIGLWDGEVEIRLISELLRTWFSEAIRYEGPAFVEGLQLACGRMFTQWRSCHRQQLEDSFQMLVEKLGLSIEVLHRRITMAVERVIHIDPYDLPETHRSNGIEIALSFRELNVALSDFRLPWWSALVSARRRRELAVSRLRERFSEFVRRYQDAVLSVLEAAGDDWADQLSGRLAAEIDWLDDRIASRFQSNPSFTNSMVTPETQECLEGVARDILRITDPVTPLIPGNRRVS